MFLPQTTRNFEKLASTVADSLFLTQTPLEESIVKIAKSLDLRPEEIRRLVEKSNTTATSRFMRAAKDLKGEIKLASYDSVVQQTHPVSEQPSMNKVASAVGDVPRNFGDRRKATVPMQKVAFERAPKPSYEDTPIQTYFKLKKVAEELNRNKIAAEMSSASALEDLATTFFAVRHPDFSKFACEAYTIHGAKAAPVLEALAKYVREDTSLQKVAYIVDDSDPLLVKLAEVLTGLDEIIRIQNELTTTEAAISATWDSASRGK